MKNYNFLLLFDMMALGAIRRNKYDIFEREKRINCKWLSQAMIFLSG
jgi:hypothetical protein